MQRLSELVIRPETTARWLRQSLTRAHPPQALLLVGAPGVGKRTVANALIAAWLCPQRTPDGACGACESCLKWSEEGSHPDLRVLRPSPDQIKIESVREARQWMNFAPTIAPFRFVLIEEAHRLNPAAANALLKTLEEPPPRYHFVLTSPASDLLIATILSRCQLVRLGVVPIAELAAILVARGVEPAKAQRIAELSEGAIGRALRWSQTDAVEWQTLESMLALFATLGSAPSISALRLAEQFRALCKQLEGGADETSARAALATGLEYLLRWYRDSLAPPEKRQFASHHAALEQLARRTPPAQRLEHIARITEARRAILGNANAQIITEDLFIHLLA
ncbi:MAG: DNA polymerase III subunit delta' [Armatimonadetes bacterium]|nr:DNA polymerase III subunit delta' [Armatimonadota bacterium]